MRLESQLCFPIQGYQGGQTLKIIGDMSKPYLQKVMAVCGTGIFALFLDFICTALV